MTGSNVPTINVYAKTHHVAELKFHGPQQCSWVYTPTWQQQGFAVSPHLPLNGEQIATANVINFLRNLFPEGPAFESLIASQHLSRRNIYGILSAIGHDTVGVLTFGEHPPETDTNPLRIVTENELTERLAHNADMTLWDGKYRLSVAGVQSKLNVYVNDTQELFLASGHYASTHILKFASAKHPTLVLNEFFCMRLAHQVGLTVASVKLLKLGSYHALEVQRFDRRHVLEQQVEGQVDKRHIIDACQALNLPPEFKYEQNFGSGRDVKHIRDGVSLTKLFQLAKQTSVPAHTAEQLLDWVLFNLVIGNSDAHGKNVSFYVGRSGALTLSPFYDLVSVVYEAMSQSKQQQQLDTQLAMAIGDNFDIDQVTAFDLLSFADEAGIKFDLLQRRLEQLVDDVERQAMQLNLNDTKITVVQYEQLRALAQLVQQRCRYFREQANLFAEVQRSAF
ncbi:HipA domain-containing protein [Pseudidiomarina donghaiensis]|uniref:Type II toxin-antitoxin system HipA family toxin n=1 Tax=Pseudidiomarina donghaiensis TaxID=519452 RepID=A0A432XIJ7_9GAMM|nr:HipA domain-containing protein [Pseudidiomarina donghaiensis]RUO48446.1 type II toxin-antitoxin system HipA family toxin [Pseudidiomarina donghaiensis]SFV24127.1 serine/threonine-protein kinase HipA [Pseudidiomarina donghaiensis]